MVSLDGSLSKIENRESTRAVVRYARVSAHKARPVLNQIRNKSVGRADEILAFSERSVSDVISGCLQSAVANARNNDGIPQEELFVSECFADEGPTLKRFRPRARGRATSIFKRTCHLTVVVSRYSESELETFQTRAELKNANMKNSDFSYANFGFADLSNADMERANMAYVYFRNANLAGANLEGANLQGANLQGANLQGANLNCFNHQKCN